MEKKIKDFIQSQELFSPDDKILLAISGGIDSVCMLHLFYECVFSFDIAHCNFQLRGDESDKDEIFVKNLAERYTCNYFSKKFDTEKYADNCRISVQMAARELRYDWFEEILRNNEFKYVAVAHNQDDLVETFFINLARGTGLKGLTGIKVKTNNIIRPLLFATRDEIEKYASEKNILYREDSSNQSTKYLRNKIRHEIIPVFKELNPAFTKTIAGNTMRFSHAEKIYEDALSKIKSSILKKESGNYYLDINKLTENKDLAKTILFEILKDFNFSNKIIDDIIHSLDGTPGKEFYSETHRLIRDRDFLIVTSLKKREGQVYYIDENTGEINDPISLKFLLIEKTDDFEIKKDKSVAYIDFAKLEFPLILRKWHHGDYFHPFGMDNLKKLSDFFVDNKFSIIDKENTWILASGEKIVWVVGHRLDNRFKVSINTTEILKINFVDQDSLFL